MIDATHRLDLRMHLSERSLHVDSMLTRSAIPMGRNLVFKDLIADSMQHPQTLVEIQRLTWQFDSHAESGEEINEVSDLHFTYPYRSVPTSRLMMVSFPLYAEDCWCRQGDRCGAALWISSACWFAERLIKSMPPLKHPFIARRRRVLTKSQLSHQHR